MLITFFISKTILHEELVPEGQMITKEFYLRDFGVFAEANCMCDIRGVEESQFQSPLQQCAGAHHNNCATVLGEKKCSSVQPLAYSPDLSPWDYFAIPKLEIELKGDQYKNIQGDLKVCGSEIKGDIHS